MTDVIKRWIVWDGFYSECGGFCNQGVKPVTTNEGVQERLRGLGFYSGLINNNLDAATLAALQDFKRHAALADDEFLDQETRNRLKNIHDDGLPERTVKQTKTTRQWVFTSRNEANLTGRVGLTICTARNLGVRVVSCPSDFIPTREFAAIEVQFTGFKEVRSMLIRIYRNFDLATDEDAIPSTAKIVYQEVLDRDQIKSLPTSSPGDGNTGTYGLEKSRILRNKRRHGFAYLRPLHAPYKAKVWVSTQADSFDGFKVPAPPGPPTYLALEMENLQQLRALAHEAGLVVPPPQVDFFEAALDRLHHLRQIQREPLTVAPTHPGALLAPPTGGIYSTPTVVTRQLVHDESDRIDAEALGPDTAADLPPQWKAWKPHTALQNRWTTNPSAQSINLLHRQCANADGAHNIQFHVDHQFQLNQFVEDASNAPLVTYRNLWNNRKQNNNNFAMPELAETFENILRHIARIRQALCCGNDRWLDATVKNPIEAEMVNQDNLARAIIANNYRYQDALDFVCRFSEVLDYHVYATTSMPEAQSYGFDPTQYMAGGVVSRAGQQEMMTMLRDRRDLVDGLSFAPDGTHWWAGEAGGMATAAAGTGPLGRSGDDGAERIWTRTRAVPEVICIPSYNPLNAEFFTRIRHVPLFLLGLIDIPFLNADGIRQGPGAFFNHDNFHIMDFDKTNPKQQWHTLEARVQELLASNPLVYPSRFDVYQMWEANVNIVRTQMAAIGNPADKEAVEWALFFLWHEPSTALVGAPVAVPEQTKMLDRLNADLIGLGQWESGADRDTMVPFRNTPGMHHDMVRRILIGEFGRFTHIQETDRVGLTARFDTARNWLIGTAILLTDG